MLNGCVFHVWMSWWIMLFMKNRWKGCHGIKFSICSIYTLFLGSYYWNVHNIGLPKLLLNSSFIYVFIIVPRLFEMRKGGRNENIFKLLTYLQKFNLIGLYFSSYEHFKPMHKFRGSIRFQTSLKTRIKLRVSFSQMIFTSWFSWSSIFYIIFFTIKYGGLVDLTLMVAWWCFDDYIYLVTSYLCAKQVHIKMFRVLKHRLYWILLSYRIMIMS